MKEGTLFFVVILVIFISITVGGGILEMALHRVKAINTILFCYIIGCILVGALVMAINQ